VQSCHQGKRWLLWRIQNIKYIFICLTLFGITKWVHMCYLKVWLSSLLFYYVENGTNKENPCRCVQTFDWYCMCVYHP
jgi:hypothetical protein